MNTNRDAMVGQVFSFTRGRRTEIVKVVAVNAYTETGVQAVSWIKSRKKWSGNAYTFTASKLVATDSPE